MSAPPGEHRGVPDEIEPAPSRVTLREIITFEQSIRDDPDTEDPADVRAAMTRLSEVAAPIVAQQARMSVAVGSAVAAADFGKLVRLSQSFAGGPRAAGLTRADIMARMPTIEFTKAPPIKLPPNPELMTVRNTAKIARTVAGLAEYVRAADDRAAESKRRAVAADARAAAAEARQRVDARWARAGVIAGVLGVLVAILAVVLGA